MPGIDGFYNIKQQIRQAYWIIFWHVHVQLPLCSCDFAKMPDRAAAAWTKAASATTGGHSLSRNTSFITISPIPESVGQANRLTGGICQIGRWLPAIRIWSRLMRPNLMRTQRKWQSRGGAKDRQVCSTCNSLIAPVEIANALENSSTGRVSLLESPTS